MNEPRTHTEDAISSLNFAEQLRSPTAVALDPRISIELATAITHALLEVAEQIASLHADLT